MSRHRDTSAAAYARILPRAPADRRKVLAVLGAGPATCDELEQALRLSHQTCSARCCELRADGSIVDSGERRPTRSGSKATVWRLATPTTTAAPAAL